MSKQYVIGLDDGHGMDTTGKRTPDGYQENEFNHFTKVELTLILESLGFKVIDCSPSRSSETLGYRCRLANHNNCDVFISIHYNAYGTGEWNKVRGIETFHHPLAPVDGGAKLAQLIHKNLRQGTVMPDRGIKSADFYVLRNTLMPAVLVECGFMTNREDAILMKSSDYRKECAQEIAKGICEFLGVEYKVKKEERQMDYKEILNLVSPWGSKYIQDVERFHKEGFNWKGVIPVIYYHERR